MMQQCPVVALQRPPLELGNAFCANHHGGRRATAFQRGTPYVHRVRPARTTRHNLKSAGDLGRVRRSLFDERFETLPLAGDLALFFPVPTLVSLASGSRIARRASAVASVCISAPICAAAPDFSVSHFRPELWPTTPRASCVAWRVTFNSPRQNGAPAAPEPPWTGLACSWGRAACGVPVQKSQRPKVLADGPRARSPVSWHRIPDRVIVHDIDNYTNKFKNTARYSPKTRMYLAPCRASRQKDAGLARHQHHAEYRDCRWGLHNRRQAAHRSRPVITFRCEPPHGPERAVAYGLTGLDHRASWRGRLRHGLPHRLPIGKRTAATQAGLLRMEEGEPILRSVGVNADLDGTSVE